MVVEEKKGGRLPGGRGCIYTLVGSARWLGRCWEGAGKFSSDSLEGGSMRAFTVLERTRAFVCWDPGLRRITRSWYYIEFDAGGNMGGRWAAWVLWTLQRVILERPLT